MLYQQNVGTFIEPVNICGKSKLLFDESILIYNYNENMRTVVKSFEFQAFSSDFRYPSRNSSLLHQSHMCTLKSQNRILTIASHYEISSKEAKNGWRFVRMELCLLRTCLLLSDINLSEMLTDYNSKSWTR